MAKIDTISISFGGKEYVVACIPDIYSGSNQEILIGSYSLNEVLYDDNMGYANEEACQIDEQIYAYIDDDCFSSSLEEFLERVKSHID